MCQQYIAEAVKMAVGLLRDANSHMSCLRREMVICDLNKPVMGEDNNYRIDFLCKAPSKGHTSHSSVFHRAKSIDRGGGCGTSKPGSHSSEKHYEPNGMMFTTFPSFSHDPGLFPTVMIGVYETCTALREGVEVIPDPH